MERETFNFQVSFKDGRIKYYNNLDGVSWNIDKILKAHKKDTIRFIESTNNLTGYKSKYYNTVEPKMTEKDIKIAVQNFKIFIGKNKNESIRVSFEGALPHDFYLFKKGNNRLFLFNYIDNFVGIKHDGGLVDLTYTMTERKFLVKTKEKKRTILLQDLQNLADFSFFILINNHSNSIRFTQPPIEKSGTIQIERPIKINAKDILYWLENTIVYIGTSI